MTIHLRNGRAQRHPPTMGDGATWCGKKLLGESVLAQNGVFTYLSYGAEIEATLDPSYATCERCKTAFDATYTAAFPNGPEPIATCRLDDPESVERFKRAFSREALIHAMGPDGGGLAEIERNLRGDES